MPNKLQKQRLRRLLATISPADKPELLVGGLEDEIKDLSSRLAEIKDYSNAIAELQYNLQSLRNDIISKIENLPNKDALSEIKKNYLEQLIETRTKLKTLSGRVDDELSRLNDGQSKTEKELKDVLIVLEKWKDSILLMIPRGGNINRQIRVDGTDVLTRYTDVNLKAGTGVSLSSADDNTNKRVDITLSASGGAPVLTATGTVDGSNATFDFSVEPNFIVVDGRPMRKTNSDGTANWTGTTTVTLSIAPNFDIFGV